MAVDHHSVLFCVLKGNSIFELADIDNSVLFPRSSGLVDLLAQTIYHGYGRLERLYCIFSVLDSHLGPDGPRKSITWRINKHA